ncbi:MAG: hypothetical protein ACRDT8_00820 [Micromonosporaceae bacterium]
MNDYSGSYGYGHDLTPGNFMAEDTIDVKLDSLYDFGKSFQNEVMKFFLGSIHKPLMSIKYDYGKSTGERTLGNSETFEEAVTVADHLSGKGGAAELAEKLTYDLFHGNLALAWVAQSMAQKYGATDGFNSVQLAGAVSDAFGPQKGENTLGSMWSKTDATLTEANRKAMLPRVSGDNIYPLLAAGQIPGKDFIIEDTSTGPGGPDNFEDPAHDGDFSNGEDGTPDDPSTEKKDESGSGDEFFKIDKEEDYDTSPDPYMTPQEREAMEDERNKPTYQYGYGYTTT